MYYLLTSPELGYSKVDVEKPWPGGLHDLYIYDIDLTELMKKCFKEIDECIDFCSNITPSAATKDSYIFGCSFDESMPLNL